MTVVIAAIIVMMRIYMSDRIKNFYRTTGKRPEREDVIEMMKDVFIITFIPNPKRKP